MSLDGSLSIASASLANVSFQLSVVSNNVANANSPDYTAEIGTQENLTAGIQGMGVLTGATTRAINLSLQQSVFQQDTVVSGLTTTTASLAAIDAVHGTPGLGNDLGGLLGKMADAFSTLLGNPSGGAQQSAVVTAAGNLTAGINSLSNAYTRQRQAAQSDIARAVTEANTALNQIGSLSNRIIAAQSSGQSTADLENQRDAAVHGLGKIIGIRTLNQPNGDLIVNTVSGSQLATRAPSGPLQTTDATLAPGAFYPGGGIPGITLNGVDITSQLQGGRLGANIALRDQTLPGFQSELDEFSFSLSTRFDAQGLTLFTDPNGSVPAGGGTPVQSTYVGFAATIQVNAAVVRNPALVRDGTHDVAGSPTGPSDFTVNPSGGPAGFTAMIDRVLSFTLGAQAQSGVPQPATATSGLGADGLLSAPYAAPATLAGNATALVAAQAGVSAAASNQMATEQAVQQTLTGKLTATSAVNIDSEMAHMIQLQNAYAANARIISSVQTLFSDLLQIVR